MFDNMMSAENRQQAYDRYDALSDACWSLNQALEALEVCRCDGYPDEVSMLQDIATTLRRDRDAAHAQLERIDAEAERTA